jgi:hypothetical protein
MLTINIGLANPTLGGFNTVDQTLKAALPYLQDVCQIRISDDGDEPTVIIDFAYCRDNLKVLTYTLDQDCVAVFDHKLGKGTLIGDKADQWGEFNLEYFQFTNTREYA